MGDCSQRIKKVKLTRFPSKFDLKKCLKFKKIHPARIHYSDETLLSDEYRAEYRRQEFASKDSIN
ncbi:hypothetical protein DOY81_012577, partial [Sarcophaga bullata]